MHILAVILTANITRVTCPLKGARTHTLLIHACTYLYTHAHTYFRSSVRHTHTHTHTHRQRNAHTN